MFVNMWGVHVCHGAAPGWALGTLRLELDLGLEEELVPWGGRVADSRACGHGCRCLVPVSWVSQFLWAVGGGRYLAGWRPCCPLGSGAICGMGAGGAVGEGKLLEAGGILG